MTEKLTVADRAEGPNLFKVFPTLHVSIHGNTRTRVNLFAVAKILFSWNF